MVNLPKENHLNLILPDEYNFVNKLEELGVDHSQRQEKARDVRTNTCGQVVGRLIFKGLVYYSTPASGVVGLKACTLFMKFFFFF